MTPAEKLTAVDPNVMSVLFFLMIPVIYLVGFVVVGFFLWLWEVKSLRIYGFVPKYKQFRKRPVLVRAYQHRGRKPVFINTLEGKMLPTVKDGIYSGMTSRQGVVGRDD